MFITINFKTIFKFQLSEMLVFYNHKLYLNYIHVITTSTKRLYYWFSVIHFIRSISRVSFDSDISILLGQIAIERLCSKMKQVSRR